MPGKHVTSQLALIVLVILALSMVSGCCMCCGVGTGKFIFFDRHTGITTKIVSGSDPWPRPITSVQYSYNERTGKLNVLDPIHLYSSYPGLKMAYGKRSIAKGDTDAGGSSGFQLIHDLPYGDTDVKITDIDGDGTVHFTYQNKDIKLKPGENWTGEEYYDTLNVPGRNGNVLVNLTKVDTFTNYGLFDISMVES